MKNNKLEKINCLSVAKKKHQQSTGTLLSLGAGKKKKAAPEKEKVNEYTYFDFIGNRY